MKDAYTKPRETQRSFLPSSELGASDFNQYRSSSQLEPRTRTYKDVANDYIRKRPKYKKTQTARNPLAPPPKPPKPDFKKIDYLKEMRKSKNEEHMSPYMDWKDLASRKLEGSKKVELIKEKARMIEESAARQERLLKVAPSSVKDANKVNDLLIGAIEAKLAILDEI